MKIVDIEYLNERCTSWDLSTPNDNFVCKLGDAEIVVHNSPALFFGYLNGKFFVATKSLFNKEPKINFSIEDIDKNHTGGVTVPLKLAFEYLKDITPKNRIFQGDFLFGKDTLKKEDINGVPHYSWQPNTIKYTCEINSALGKRIVKAKIGIAVHTEYQSGKDVSSIKLKGFGVSEEDFKKSADVFLVDAYHKDVSKNIALDKADLELLNDTIKTTQNIKLNWLLLDDATFKTNIMAYVNTFFRNNTVKPAPAQRTEKFLLWIKEKAIADENSKKTEKGKMVARDRWSGLIAAIEQNKKDIINLFIMHDKLTEAKLMLISYLNKLSSTENFFVKSDGKLEVTGEEGFVIATTSARGVKLVDRAGFSKTNFSADYKKGWDH